MFYQSQFGFSNIITVSTIVRLVIVFWFLVSFQVGFARGFEVTLVAGISNAEMLRSFVSVQVRFVRKWSIALITNKSQTLVYGFLVLFEIAGTAGKVGTLITRINNSLGQDYKWIYWFGQSKDKPSINSARDRKRRESKGRSERKGAKHAFYFYQIFCPMLYFWV